MASHPQSRFTQAAASGLAAVLLVASCSTAQGAENPNAAGTADTPTTVTTMIDADSDETMVSNTDVALFDGSIVHNIEVSFDDAAYDEMIETFATTGDKSWIGATIVVDGTTFEDAGIRLKGNSSLFGLNASTAGDPEDLPWLIRLDKYVDDQAYQGYTDIVIRSSSTETALNEAVAQELLDLAGLANQDPISTTFTVNGGETELRLALEHPDDDWDDANFDNDDGALYKADSEGDYSYRGDDAGAYDDIFDQKAGDDDLEPLIDFLEFTNNTDDATFSADLGDYLDLDAFATYMAFQDLVGNADDINGRGNNSYLHYDYEAEQFTVVNWDLNLAFNTANVNGGGPGAEIGAEGAGRPERRDGAGPGAGGAAGGPGDQSNVLVDRFMADDEFAELYKAKTDELRESLFTSGAADDILATWVELLSADATQLVDAATLDAEAAAIATYLAGAS